MQRIAVIGGGTGSYSVLRGLKKHDVMLTAVVSMMDSGGSTGLLRDEFGILPPGDVRRCLIALSPDTSTLRELFEYRFKKGKGLNGHSFGNLFLTALSQIIGNDAKAIKEAAKILNIKGKVLPVTTTNTHLGAVLENNQEIIGETNIDIPKHDPSLKIKKLFLRPEAKAYHEAVKALLEADKIVIGPGDLYTSVLPDLLVKGVKQAVKKSKAKKIFICNIMTKHGETTNFKAKNFVDEIEKYLGKEVIDYVICNNKKPSKELIAKYKKENSEFVEPNIKSDKYKVIETDLLCDIDLARHDPVRLANVIISVDSFPTKKKIKLLIFDLDNTLFDTYGQLGVKLLDDIINRMKRAGLSKQQEQLIRKKYMTTGFRNVAKQAKLSKELIEIGKSAYEHMDLSKIKPYPDVKLIKDFPQKKVLVTSGKEKVQNDKIRILGIKNLFDEILIDEFGDVNSRKKFFTQLLKKYDCEPEEVMIIGDNSEAEIMAGNALRMITIQILRRPFTTLKVNYYVKNLLEVKKILKEMK